MTLKEPFKTLRPESVFKIRKEKASRTILGIKFDGGFLDQQTISFTSNLNCLIGGRGTGKSSCIEAIRYLFEKQIPDERDQ